MIAGAVSTAKTPKGRLVTVFWSSPEALPAGAFGDSDSRNGWVKVLATLPKAAQRFVLAHELFHVDDIVNDGWKAREARANAYAARKEPLGALQAAFLTVTSPARLKMYLGRAKEGR